MRNSRYDLRLCIRAFTLVEMLVVMGIIAILAALILVAVVKGGGEGPKTKARIQIQQIVQSINSYHSTYSRYPVAAAAMTPAAVTNDFTYGGTALARILGPGAWTAANSDAIAMLMDLETDASGKPTLNEGHVKNPQRVKFLDATMVSDAALAGVGPDLVYRDPWGNPYIISLDAGYNEKCRDAFYCRRTVSQQAGPTGFNGLVNTTDPAGNGDNFVGNSGVMVWSLGPDRNADANQPANAPPNKDNVLSWAE